MDGTIHRKNRKSKVPLILLGLVCIVALLAASSAIMLRKGIELQRFAFASVRAERIALRIDNGIIIAIDRLEIPDRRAAASVSRPELLIPRFNAVAHLFREIRLNSIHYRGHIYTLLFQDNQFTVSGDDFQLAAALSYGEGAVSLNIAKLALTSYAAVLSGKAAYYRDNGNLTFNGRFAALGVEGRVTISQHRDLIDVEMQTDHFIDLAGPLEQLGVDQDIVSWVKENIAAREYRINTLRLGFAVKEDGLHIQPLSVNGSGIATDAAVRFDPSLPPVQCARINVVFKNDLLSFDLDAPIYQTKDLAGSRVTIGPVLGDSTRLAITLRTEAPLDGEIHDLLRTYDIQLPLTQQTGTTKADLQLLFDLPDFTLHTRGRFTTGQGTWRYKDISFQADGAAVQLRDDLITLESAAIRYPDILQARVSGTVTPETGLAMLNMDIVEFNLRDKEKTVVRIDNLATPISMRFNAHDARLHLEELQTDISLTPARNLLTMNDLRRMQPFIPSLRDFPLQAGKVNIDFTDPEDLVFDGAITTDALPLSLHNRPVTLFTFTGRRSGEKLAATINDGKISLTIADALAVHLHDYLVTVEAETLGKKAGTISSLPVVISGPAGLIKLKDLAIPTNAFRAELTGTDVTFTAALAQGNILFEANGGEMKLAATEIDALIARDFLQFSDLEGGRFNLSLKGENEQNVEGFVEFSNVLIKDAALLNNVLSFINAIPALATLSSPGFDTNGYRVKDGVFHFTLRDNLLTLHQFRTDGATINIEAEGWLNLADDSMKIEVELISLKDYSKIIGMIPWAGYAILGENGSLSTSLLITGTRKDPEITTNVSAEIVMMPVNVVKRAIQWPFRLFGRIRDLAAETPETEE